MKKLFLSFRKFVAIGLFLFGALALAPAATVPPGTVTKVDQKARTFTVHWTTKAVSHHGMASGYAGTSRERTFKTTDKTTYLVGSAKGSWSDIQTGVLVNVKAHAQGSDRVADVVQIVKSS
jgi:hypothetical protein